MVRTRNGESQYVWEPLQAYFKLKLQKWQSGINTNYNSCKGVKTSSATSALSMVIAQKTSMRLISAFGTNKVNECHQEYHNHSVQAHPQHHEEDSQNTNSNKTSGRQSSKQPDISYPSR